MFWYIFIATMPVWIGLVIQASSGGFVTSSKKNKKVYIILCSIVLFVMIAFRHYSLGSVDSMNYYNIWELMRNSSVDMLKFYMEKSKIEPTFLAVVWGLSRVFVHPQFMFILSGALFSVAIGRFIYKNSENPILSMTMFICVGLYIFMVQGLRQSISISICLFAVEYCKRRKTVRFFILIFLATLFHRSSIVFSLVYFLYGANFTKMTKTMLFAIPVLLFVFMPNIMIVGNDALARDYNTAAEMGGGLIASAIYVLVLGFAYIYLDEKNSGKKETFFIAFTMCGASFYLMRYFGTQVFERISFYFLVGQAIVLPDTIKHFTKRSQNIINFVVIALSVALFIYRIKTSYTIPFLFFWQR